MMSSVTWILKVNLPCDLDGIFCLWNGAINNIINTAATLFVNYYGSYNLVIIYYLCFGCQCNMV